MATPLTSCFLGRAPREFRVDDADLKNLSEDFEIWLEIPKRTNFTLQNVTEAASKKTLLLNLAGLGIRKIVRGLSLPTASGLRY